MGVVSGSLQSAPSWTLESIPIASNIPHGISEVHHRAPRLKAVAERNPVCMASRWNQGGSHRLLHMVLHSG